MHVATPAYSDPSSSLDQGIKGVEEATAHIGTACDAQFAFMHSVIVTSGEFDRKAVRAPPPRPRKGVKTRSGGQGVQGRADSEEPLPQRLSEEQKLLHNFPEELAVLLEKFEKLFGAEQLVGGGMFCQKLCCFLCRNVFC